MKVHLALFAAAALSLTVSGNAIPQQAGTQAQRAENTRDTNTVRARIAAAQDRVVKAAADHKITRARATALKRQLAQTRQSMGRLGARQGFVSAAELASYNRTLSSIDTELDRRGVARSYGNDMLPAAHHGRH